MTFTYEVDVPTEDGAGTEKVTLEFKSMKDLPIGILRRHRRDYVGQMMATFEWGLSPEHLEVFDRLPLTSSRTILDAWEASANEDADAKDEKADDDQQTAGIESAKA